MLADAVAFMAASGYNCTLAMMGGVFVLVFLASHFNDNYSWVDRSWSIVPVVYTWVQVGFAVREAKTTAVPFVSAATVFAALITCWGARLTFNFFRRGGYYRGGEDYRWNWFRTHAVFRAYPVLWPIFNFFVVSLFQTWLLWAITLPVSNLSVTAPPRPADALMALVFLVLLVLETTCDNQQWRFHQLKQAGKATERFCVTGLFGYSRHMNVFCEGMMWVTLAAAAHLGKPLAAWQWSGCVVLELLTWYSTGCITERLTRTKYPEYAVYQRTTSMLVPGITSSTARTRFLLHRATKKTRAQDDDM